MWYAHICTPRHESPGFESSCTYIKIVNVFLIFLISIRITYMGFFMSISFNELTTLKIMYTHRMLLVSHSRSILSRSTKCIIIILRLNTYMFVELIWLAPSSIWY